MHDLVIRGGTVVDGTGAPRFTATSPSMAASSPRSARELGDGQGRDRRRRGKIVTPGFVDIHTHYDGQATWDPDMAPSSWHGVTTVVMGNCGVGFAPAQPDKHEWLIGLMEGVEDIPGTALAEGMTWNWETFPEYLDALERLPRTIDVGTHVPHGAVRAYVMGERGARNEEPTETDIAQMSQIVEEGLRAGALGFSTSRTILHRSVDGELVPGTTATKEELIGIGRAMGRVGYGVFEMASDLKREWNEFEWMGELSRETDAARHLRRAAIHRQGTAARQSRSAKCAPKTPRAPTSSRRSRCAETASSWPGKARCIRSASARPGSKSSTLPWPEQLAHLKDPAFKQRMLTEDERLPGKRSHRPASWSSPAAGRCNTKWVRTSTTSRRKPKPSPRAPPQRAFRQPSTPTIC